MLSAAAGVAAGVVAGAGVVSVVAVLNYLYEFSDFCDGKSCHMSRVISTSLFPWRFLPLAPLLVLALQLVLVLALQS